LHELGKLGADALDGVRVHGDVGGGRPSAFEERPHVHEAFQLQDEIVEPAQAASSCNASVASSTCGAAGFDSSSTAASTAPAAAIAART
jgi:hypothetical protein